MADSRKMIKLSKFLALVLRHQPERFALAIDGEGWASFSEILEILRGLPNFRWATRADVMAIVEGRFGRGKSRFEVQENRIRARYGHSFAQPIHYEACTPPSVLYHGTVPKALATIRRTGLLPMERQYVHLSPDPETAALVGARRASQSVILTIRAQEAGEAGIVFYQADRAVFLTKHVPVTFIDVPGEQVVGDVPT